MFSCCCCLCGVVAGGVIRGAGGDGVAGGNAGIVVVVVDGGAGRGGRNRVTVVGVASDIISVSFVLVYVVVLDVAGVVTVVDYCIGTAVNIMIDIIVVAILVVPVG